MGHTQGCWGILPTVAPRPAMGQVSVFKGGGGRASPPACSPPSPPNTAIPPPPAPAEPRQPPVRASPPPRRHPPCRGQPHRPRLPSHRPRLSPATCPPHPQGTCPPHPRGTWLCPHWTSCPRWTSCPQVSAGWCRDAQCGEGGAACGLCSPRSPSAPIDSAGVVQPPTTPSCRRPHQLCLTLRTWPHRRRPPQRIPPQSRRATWRKVRRIPEPPRALCRGAFG